MKKKVLYVERGIDEYGLYEGTQDAMKDLNVEFTPHFYAHIWAGLKVILPPVCKHTWFQTF